jgi:CBS domain-containing protein
MSPHRASDGRAAAPGEGVQGPTAVSAPELAYRGDLSVEVQQLLRRPARWIEAGATVGDAARVMRAEGISSVLIPGEPPAILTDRDLRGRVLAEGLGPTTPAERVASRPILTIRWGSPVYEAWQLLLDSGVRHLPVERDGRIEGMLTSGDLLRHTARGPVAILRRVEGLADRRALPGYADHVAEMVEGLVAGGLDATVIAGLVARLNDALTVRILRWAEEELGPPPAPYAWIATGSEGRMEQTLLTDQDNLLAYADEGEPRADWYLALAERANADLEAAGFPPCSGGHMARNHRASLSTWRARFKECVEEPRPHEAELWYDFRRVAGELDVSPLEEALAAGARSPMLLRFMAREALEFSPPAPLLVRVRGADQPLNLKAHGLSPIVFLARCQAIEVGATDRSTVGRLEAARAAGLMSEEQWAEIADAYRFLLGLRLRLQLARRRAGVQGESAHTLAELTPRERRRLREAFGAIRTWQEEAGFHYQVFG